MQERSTKDEHFIDGTYTQERLAIHDSIIGQITEKMKPSEDKPLTIFLGGGSASGKTSISELLIHSFHERNESVVHIDSDKIKKLLPEYNELTETNPEKAATVLHDESSDISEKLYQECLEKQVNIIFDGTMKNTDKYERFIDAARENKYEVSIVIADVPLQEAYQRADRRYEIERRLVPREIIKESHEKVPATFHHLKDKVDSFYLYDTTSRHPEQFYVKERGQIKIMKQDRIAEFYSKAGINFTKENEIKSVKKGTREKIQESKSKSTGFKQTKRKSKAWDLER